MGDNYQNDTTNEGKENLESYIMLEGNEFEDTSYLQTQFQLSFNLNGLILTASSFSTFDPLAQLSCSNTTSDNNNNNNNNYNSQNNDENNSHDINSKNIKEYEGVFTSQEIEDNLDEVRSNVCILNKDGVIIFTNRSWRQFSNSNGKQDCKTTDIGTNYLRICRQAANAAKDDCVRTNAKAFYEGLTRLIDAETTEEFTLIYPCDSPTEKRWYLARAFTFHLSEGIQRTIISHQYISDTDKQNNDEKNNKMKNLQSQCGENNNNICDGNNNHNNEVPKDNCELNNNSIDPYVYSILF